MADRDDKSVNGVGTESCMKTRKRTSTDSQCEVAIEKLELKQSITLGGAVAILLASIGGASIFIAPTTILIYSGSPGMALLMWTLGGLIQAGMAFSVTEVTLMFNKAGGPYYFIYQIFGDLAGFVFIWGYLLFVVGPVWALGSYISSLYFLTLFFPNCEVSDGLVKLLAAWIMLTLVAVNCTYMKLITGIQKLLSSSKVIAVVILVIFGFLDVPTELGQDNISQFMVGTNTDIGNIALALFSGFYAYGGWLIITILAEEIKTPEKTVPMAVGLSFVIAILTSVATAFAYYVVLSKQDALSSDATAVAFCQRIHPALTIVVTTLVCACCVSSLNAIIMGQPRILYAAGLNGHMPRMMTLLHKKFHTPWPSLFTMSLSGLVMLSIGSLQFLLEAISLYAAFMVLMLMLCFLFLRWKRPNAPRPIRVPLVFPIFSLLLTVILMFVSVLKKPDSLGLVAIVIAVGVPIYFVCVKWQKPAKLFSYIDVIADYLKVLLELDYPHT